MRSYVEHVKEIIDRELSGAGSGRAGLFRIEAAPDPKVYLEIARHFRSWAQIQGRELIAKLAAGKYRQFEDESNPHNKSVLEALTQEDFVDKDNHMTYWRNQAARGECIILLMGTEAVEDKGGLSDFFAITPELIDRELNGNYAAWFEKRLGLPFSDRERSAIHNVVANIFRVSTRNLYRLSEIIDDLEHYTGHLDGEAVIAFLFDRFYRDWQLPRWRSNFPSLDDLAAPGKARSLFDELADFRSRQSYRNLPRSRMARLIEAIEQTETEISPYRAPGYSSLSELKNDLICYVTGQNLPEVGPRILDCDYSLIRELVRAKPRQSKSRQRKNVTPKVHGDPLRAFLSMIVNTVADDPTVETLFFTIKSIRLAGCSTTDELRQQWHRLRIGCGGLLDFLNEELSATCSLTVGWRENRDPFTATEVERLIEEETLSRAAASKKLSTIEFVVETTDGEKNEFLWEFHPKAPWTYTFFHVVHVLNTRDLERYGRKFIPIVPLKRFTELIMSNNEEEFFARLEAADVDNSWNIVSYFKDKLPIDAHGALISRVESLGERFTEFLAHLSESGFYAVTTENSARQFIEDYCSLISWLGETPLTSAARDALPALVNAFLLIDANQTLSDKGLSAAVVLPVHPAMLEKLMAQAQFVRDGATEVINTLRRKNDDTDETLRTAEQRLRTFEQLSTVSLAVDTLWSKHSGNYLPPKNTFGYFAIYRDTDTWSTRVSLSNIVVDDVAADEEIPKDEVFRESPISEVISKKLYDYLKTFPSQSDGLHVVFVNPPDLQPVVAGIHKVIDKTLRDRERTLRDRGNGSKVRVRLTVLAPPQSIGSRSYLHYWLDNFFEDTDQVDISTYFKTISFARGNLGNQIRRALSSAPMADVTFVQNVMTVREIQFEKAASYETDPQLTRFPMVFHPLPVFSTSTFRKTRISQPQFRASSAHTRLLFYLSSPMNTYMDCGVVNHLQLQPDYEELLNAVHEHSRWVVCVDPGIDREIISSSEQRIISFATGEGPFGELNVTVSSRRDSTIDLASKLKARLRALFRHWDERTLEAAAEQCLRSAERLDGAHLLQALNPDDHQLHNFLAYVLTAQHLKVDDVLEPGVLVRTLVPLDSYDHWFRPNVDQESRGSGKRPDFLLLEVRRDGHDENVVIHATVIECKMGLEQIKHVEEGCGQLANGLRVLKSIWDPNRESIDKRYWYSQLYRALVFSKVNMAENDAMYWEFNQRLQRILDGKFSITWKALLLTYWLDSESDSIEVYEHPLPGCGDIRAEQRAFGQHTIQRMLGRKESELVFSRPTESVEPEDGGHLESGAQREHGRLGGMTKVVAPPESAVSKATSSTEVGSDSQPVLVAPSPQTQVAEHESPEASTVTTEIRVPVRQIRLLIGEDVQTGERVYWEFGHPELQNRHILITGSSGTGKTYFIQALLLELSQHGVSSLIFDYTDGFTSQKLEPEFIKRVGDRVVQLPIYHQPFPLNPFKRYPIEVAGEVVLQKPVDVAERIKSAFAKVFDLGDQQANAVYNAVKKGLEQYGDRMTLANFGEELRRLAENLPPARTALARLQPLIDRDPFDHSSSQDWSILDENPGCIVVVQLSGFTRDVQVAITQLILWDAWYYQVKHGHKDKPFPVILDEAQNLDHSETSPTAMILTEGRKFGWSGWFATQFLKGQMEKDELGRLQQASQKVFFKPPEAELRDVALMIDPDRGRTADWEMRLARLQKGQCVVSGWVERNGQLQKDRPRIVRVAPLSVRGGA